MQVDCHSLLCGRSTKSEEISLWNTASFQPPSVDCRRSLHEVRHHKEERTYNQRLNPSQNLQPTHSHSQQAICKEQRIYGQKLTYPITETAQKEAMRTVVSVPFRSPTSVILGYNVKGTEVKNRVHAEYIAHTAKKEASEMLKLFSDRYRKAPTDNKDSENTEAIPEKQVEIEPKFQDIGGFPGENSNSFKSIDSKISHIAEKTQITEEITEELARRQRYRMKLKQKQAKQTYPSRLISNHSFEANDFKTKSPVSVKWPGTVFEDTEEKVHQSPEVRERRLRRISQTGNLRFPQSNLENNKGMLKQIANDWAASVNVRKPTFNSKPLNHRIKQSTVTLGPSASEMFVRESTSEKSTMRRIKGESSLKSKVTKMFKKLENEAGSNLPELRKSRKVIICKTSPAAHDIQGRTHRSKRNNSFGHGRKQERSVQSASVSRSSDITTEKYTNPSGNHQRAYAISDILAKPEHSKKRRFRPILLDVKEEQNHVADTTRSQKSQTSSVKDIDELEMDPQSALIDDSSRNVGVEDNLKPKNESEGLEKIKFQGDFRDELGRAWELTSYDRHIVDDCRKKMMKLTLLAEHKDDESGEQNPKNKTEHVGCTPIRSEANGVNDNPRLQEQHGCDSGGEGDGGRVPKTEKNKLVERIVLKNVIKTKKTPEKKPKVDYDKIWTWRD